MIPEPAPAPRWRLGWALHAGGASAVAPGLARTLGGFVEVALDGGGVISPAFRLGFLEADSGTLAVAPGEAARLALTAARAEGCPVRLAPVPWLSILPCVVLDVGALQASGIARVSSVPSTTRPWAAPGASARIAVGDRGARLPRGRGRRRVPPGPGHVLLRPVDDGARGAGGRRVLLRRDRDAFSVIGRPLSGHRRAMVWRWCP